jgi:hypothetical protein
MYAQLAEELFKDQQEYISKVAKTEADACSLVEAGFEYVCEHNEAKISGSQNTDFITRANPSALYL